MAELTSSNILDQIVVPLDYDYQALEIHKDRLTVEKSDIENLAKGVNNLIKEENKKIDTITLRNLTATLNTLSVPGNDLINLDTLDKVVESTSTLTPQSSTITIEHDATTGESLGLSSFSVTLNINTDHIAISSALDFYFDKNSVSSLESVESSGIKTVTVDHSTLVDTTSDEFYGYKGAKVKFALEDKNIKLNSSNFSTSSNISTEFIADANCVGFRKIIIEPALTALSLAPADFSTTEQVIKQPTGNNIGFTQVTLPQLKDNLVISNFPTVSSSSSTQSSVTTIVLKPDISGVNVKSSYEENNYFAKDDNTLIKLSSIKTPVIGVLDYTVQQASLFYNVDANGNIKAGETTSLQLQALNSSDDADQDLYSINSIKIDKIPLQESYIIPADSVALALDKQESSLQIALPASRFNSINLKLPTDYTKQKSDNAISLDNILITKTNISGILNDVAAATVSDLTENIKNKFTKECSIEDITLSDIKALYFSADAPNTLISSTTPINISPDLSIGTNITVSDNIQSQVKTNCSIIRSFEGLSFDIKNVDFDFPLSFNLRTKTCYEDTITHLASVATNTILSFKHNGKQLRPWLDSETGESFFTLEDSNSYYFKTYINSKTSQYTLYEKQTITPLLYSKGTQIIDPNNSVTIDVPNKVFSALYYKGIKYELVKQDTTVEVASYIGQYTAITLANNNIFNFIITEDKVTSPDLTVTMTYSPDNSQLTLDDGTIVKYTMSNNQFSTIVYNNTTYLLTKVQDIATTNLKTHVVGKYSVNQNDSVIVNFEVTDDYKIKFIDTETEESITWDYEIINHLESDSNIQFNSDNLFSKVLDYELDVTRTGLVTLDNTNSQDITGDNKIKHICSNCNHVVYKDKEEDTITECPKCLTNVANLFTKVGKITKIEGLDGYIETKTNTVKIEYQQQNPDSTISISEQISEYTTIDTISYKGITYKLNRIGNSTDDIAGVYYGYIDTPKLYKFNNKPEITGTSTLSIVNGKWQETKYKETAYPKIYEVDNIITSEDDVDKTLLSEEERPYFWFSVDNNFNIKFYELTKYEDVVYNTTLPSYMK